MNKYVFSFASLLFLFSFLNAKVIEVCPTCPFQNVQTAAASALPGDTILLRAGIYSTYDFIVNLKGRANAWITITSAPNEEVVFYGKSTAIQLVDPEYVRISGLIFEAQTGNGVNIDDGLTFDSPAHHIIIENCIWRNINAAGNNDLLKLSGVDSFVVRNCIFRNGSPGGSGIDMVGCHFGIIETCRFENQGSNSIQAKGGSSNITIRKNLFINGGLRALNIGGSTGLQYFRPQGVNYEASRIFVYSNIFIGSQAPIAFVGAVDCEVVNNTIYKPTKWAIRILQETTEPTFLKCGNNSFINNIVFLENISSNPAINIGPNTAPETFLFSNNLWFNKDNPNWQGPNLPVAETNGIKNADPLLVEDSLFCLRVGKLSPAAGKGLDRAEPREDYFGNLFNSPRSVGAIEVNPPTSEIPTKPLSRELLVFPNPATDHIFVIFPKELEQTPHHLEIYNILGECVHLLALPEFDSTGKVSIDHLPVGFYIIKSKNSAGMFLKK